ncbi:TraB/GumN family protein [Kiloniella antarctica]|uniref:TraB/GumN family protein n=1 Tax=Kiloniella antarctica TaxID=1550907 RepID=A0ABW5BKI2_9PROT
MSILFHKKSQTSKLRTGLLFVFLLVFTGEAVANEVPHGKGLFWKIEKGDRKPSYLLGTMHVSDKRVLKMKEEVKPYLAEAWIFYGEIVDTYREYREYINIRYRDDGKTLEDDLSEELYEKALEVAKLIDIKEKRFKNFELWYVYELMNGAPWYRGDDQEKEDDEDDYEPILDSQLEDLAYENHLKVKALEEMRPRAILINDRPKEIYLEAIERALANTDVIEDVEAERESGIQVYLDRDTERMYNELEEDLKDEPAEIYDIEKVAMLDKRNLNMVNGMTPGLVRGNSFTAVGALHLPGEKGILNILVQRGYTVSRMDCAKDEKSSFCPEETLTQ